MSRKTYKLNEEDVVSENREVLQTKKDGKLTLVLHPASKKAIDVYDGDKLVSKKMIFFIVFPSVMMNRRKLRKHLCLNF